MNATLEKVAARRATAKQKAIVEYREMLQRRDEPRPGDVEKLEALIEELGLTDAEVQQHADALSQLAHLERNTPTDADVVRAHAASEKERAEATTEMCELIAALLPTLDAAFLHPVFEAAWRSSPGLGDGKRLQMSKLADSLLARFRACPYEAQAVLNRQQEGAMRTEIIRRRFPILFG